MKVKCPGCTSMVTELMSCDGCQAIGCIRCIVKIGKRLVCHNCKGGKAAEEQKEAGLFSMFG